MQDGKQSTYNFLLNKFEGNEGLTIYVMMKLAGCEGMYFPKRTWKRKAVKFLLEKGFEKDQIEQAFNDGEHIVSHDTMQRGMLDYYKEN